METIVNECVNNVKLLAGATLVVEPLTGDAVAGNADHVPGAPLTR